MSAQPGQRSPGRRACRHENRSGLHRLLHEFLLCSICSPSRQFSREKPSSGRKPFHLAGSKQVYTMLAECGALADLIDAGARILECACGPCIGMGFSPKSGGVSPAHLHPQLRGAQWDSGRGGLSRLARTAAASALAGAMTDPRTLGKAPEIHIPTHFLINDNLIERPASPRKRRISSSSADRTSSRFPLAKRRKRIFLQAHPQGGRQHHNRPYHAGRDQILPYRSNVPKLSEFSLHGV